MEELPIGTPAQPAQPTTHRMLGEPHDCRRLAVGLRLKQVALLIFLSIPLVAWLSWQQDWQPWWRPALCLLIAALVIDLFGRALVFVSGIGSRLPIHVSLIAQGVGVTVGVLTTVVVPRYGMAIGLMAAGLFQLVAAISFTYYLQSVAGLVCDDMAARQATTSRRSIIVSLAATSLLVATALGICGTPDASMYT